jgi:hypothetical protein
MPVYAKDTEVSADRSRQEIERTLVRYGASAFMYGWQEQVAVIGFEIKGRRYRIMLPLPNLADFRLTPTRQVRTKAAQTNAYQQAERQRWRALAL